MAISWQFSETATVASLPRSDIKSKSKIYNPLLKLFLHFDLILEIRN